MKRPTMLRLTAFVSITLVFVICQACVAQSSSRRTVDEPIGLQRGGQDPADVLAQSVGDFIRKFGHEKPTGSSAALLANARSGVTDRAAVIELLQPLRHVVVTGPVTVAPNEDAAQATELKGLIAGTALLLADGVEVAVGDPVYPKDVIQVGVVLNAGNRELVLQGPLGEYVLAPGEALFASNCPKTCSVHCTKGTYACCGFDSNGCVNCYCKPAATLGCYGGGPGSDGCSIEAH